MKIKLFFLSFLTISILFNQSFSQIIGGTIEIVKCTSDALTSKDENTLKQELEEYFKSELYNYGFSVTKPGSKSLSFSYTASAHICYDNDCRKYYYCFELRAYDNTGRAEALTYGPYLSVTDSFTKMETELKDYLEAAGEEMHRKYQ